MAVDVLHVCSYIHGAWCGGWAADYFKFLIMYMQVTIVLCVVICAVEELQHVNHIYIIHFRFSGLNVGRIDGLDH